MKNLIPNGTTIALAAATLFAAACGGKSASSSSPAAPAPAEKTASVHCMGINECKGQSACMTAQNGCGGQNACKGQGYVDVPSAEECTAKGGTVKADQ